MSHREGLGGCDLLIVQGMMDWERAGGGCRTWLRLTYEENQWRHEVTLGGWAILSPPGALFETRERKKRRLRRRKREENMSSRGAVLLRIF